MEFQTTELQKPYIIYTTEIPTITLKQTILLLGGIVLCLVVVCLIILKSPVNYSELMVARKTIENNLQGYKPFINTTPLGLKVD